MMTSLDHCWLQYLFWYRTCCWSVQPTSLRLYTVFPVLTVSCRHCQVHLPMGVWWVWALTPLSWVSVSGSQDRAAKVSRKTTDLQARPSLQFTVGSKTVEKFHLYSIKKAPIGHLGRQSYTVPFNNTLTFFCLLLMSFLRLHSEH